MKTFCACQHLNQTGEKKRNSKKCTKKKNAVRSAYVISICALHTKKKKNKESCVLPCHLSLSFLYFVSADSRSSAHREREDANPTQRGTLYLKRKKKNSYSAAKTTRENESKKKRRSRKKKEHFIYYFSHEELLCRSEATEVRGGKQETKKNRK